MLVSILICIILILSPVFFLFRHELPTHDSAWVL